MIGAGRAEAGAPPLPQWVWIIAMGSQSYLGIHE